jgi:hypothetical protein
MSLSTGVSTAVQNVENAETRYPHTALFLLKMGIRCFSEASRWPSEKAFRVGRRAGWSPAGDPWAECETVRSESRGLRARHVAHSQISEPRRSGIRVRDGREVARPGPLVDRGGDKRLQAGSGATREEVLATAEIGTPRAADQEMGSDRLVSGVLLEAYTGNCGKCG